MFLLLKVAMLFTSLFSVFKSFVSIFNHFKVMILTSLGKTVKVRLVNAFFTKFALVSLIEF